MTKKTPEPELLRHPFTGEVFQSDKDALACMVAQLDAIEANITNLAKSAPPSLGHAPSLADALRAIADMRNACTEAIADLADNSDPCQNG